MPLKRVWIPSPNFSSRGGSSVRLIVLHTAEGARTYQDLGHYFANSSVQASSHVGIDDTPGVIGEYVHRPDKAWTEAAFNPVSVSVEQCAFASWSTATWKNEHHQMLENVAAWIAEEAAHWGIPIVKLTAAQAQGSGRGVCQHRDLGSAGGGHDDCGDGFPIDYVLDMARGGVTPAPDQEDGDTLIAAAVADNGNYHLFELKDGWIWYTWQNKGANNWSGGAPGKGVAGMSRFAEAKDVVSIAAETTAGGGALHVFGRKKDGSVVYTWQNAGETSWAGGAPGKAIAGLAPFAPVPK